MSPPPLSLFFFPPPSWSVTKQLLLISVSRAPLNSWLQALIRSYHNHYLCSQEGDVLHYCRNVNKKTLTYIYSSAIPLLLWYIIWIVKLHLAWLSVSSLRNLCHLATLCFMCPLCFVFFPLWPPGDMRSHLCMKPSLNMLFPQHSFIS